MNTSRIRRVARGSGRKEGEVRDLLTRFHQMRKMMGMLVNYTGPHHTPESAQKHCKQNRGKWFD